MGTKYLIVDDNREACMALKESLALLVEPESNIDCEHDPRQALLRIPIIKPKILFLDIEMPGMDGFQLWDRLKEQGFKGNVICTTAYDKYILQALRKRALDFLLKPIDRQELKEALQRAKLSLEREYYDFSKLKALSLSQRQIEISRLVLEGKTSTEIAERLFLSKHTVDTHRRNILRITGCKNIRELLTLI